MLQRVDASIRYPSLCTLMNGWVYIQFSPVISFDPMARKQPLPGGVRPHSNRREKFCYSRAGRVR